MKARTRRRIEMGVRALGFSLAHPDSSAGYATTLARLEDRLARAEQLMNLQRDGIAQVHGAVVLKRDLRRIMRRAQLMHLVRVAELAAKEVPELAQKFVLKQEQIPYLEFQASARAMLAEAQNQKELLVKHGLAETLLDDLVKSMGQFDRAVEQGSDARRIHVSASAELDAIGDETVQLVNVMDALNRSRFAGSVAILTEWESVSNVFGPVRSSEKPTSPEETPPLGGESSTAA